MRAGWADHLVALREYVAATEIPVVVRERMADLVAEGWRLQRPIALDAQAEEAGL